MIKISKIANIVLIYMIIGVFFVQDVVYSASNGTLRPEMGFSDDRKKETENRLGIVEIKPFDKKSQVPVVEEDDSVAAEQLTINDQVLWKFQALVNKYSVKIARHSIRIKYKSDSPYRKLPLRYVWPFRSLLKLIGKNREVTIEKGQDVERVLKAAKANGGSRALAAGNTITRRDFFPRLFLYPTATYLAFRHPSFVMGGQKNPVKKEAREANYDFSPAKVVASIGGPGFSDKRIIESSVTRTVHVITDLEEPLAHKMIQWKWAKAGDSWTAAKWDNELETIDLSSNREDMVLRFIVFGTSYAAYKIVLEDNSGQKIEFSSTENLTTVEGKQYSLIRLDELAKRNSSFNWRAVKPVKYVSASPAGATITIKNVEILNVKNVRDRGIGMGMFYSDDQVEGNDFPPLGGYAGMTGARPPASVLSFSGILERSVDQLTALWNKLLPGQVPHEVLEFWLPEQQLGKLGKAMAMSKQELSAFRKKAEDLKARILAGDKSENYKTAGWNNVLKRIVNGDCDDILIERAKAAAQYGKPVILRPLHEPTGQWYPWSFSNQLEADDYIAAWRHIVKIYREYGANNVVFAFSPHNYEPETLQQTRKYQLIDYVLYHLQEDINVIGVDAYSYPPSGGYVNALATGLLDLASKYKIPIMMGETSSAMSEDDKRNFWNYVVNDCKNGMYQLFAIVGFFIKKWENGSEKDFHWPQDIARQLETDSFFGPNPFAALKGGRRNKVEGLTEPGLPWRDNSRLVADWIYSGGNEEHFTLLTNDLEEWAWKRISGGADWYGWGATIDIEDRASLNNNTISNFEFSMPLEILEGEFHLILEDNQGQPVGKEITLIREKLLKYIVDGRLVIPLAQIAQVDEFKVFNWGDIRQVKMRAVSDTGKALFGRASVKKTGGTGIIENPGDSQRQTASEAMKLEQNYPNPFGASGTNISYSLNKTSNNVRMEIFDVKGRLIRNLGKVDGRAGRHVIGWDCKDNNGEIVPGGQYIAKIVVDNKDIRVKKLIKLGVTGLAVKSAAANKIDKPVVSVTLGRIKGYNKPGFIIPSLGGIVKASESYRDIIVKTLGPNYGINIFFKKDNGRSWVCLYDLHEVVTMQLKKGDKLEIKIEPSYHGHRKALPPGIQEYILKNIKTAFENEEFTYADSERNIFNTYELLKRKILNSKIVQGGSRNSL